MLNDTATLENSLIVSYKVKHAFTTQSSNLSSEGEMKTYVCTNTYTQMFITVLFITIPN